MWVDAPTIKIEFSGNKNRRKVNEMSGSGNVLFGVCGETQFAAMYAPTPGTRDRAVSILRDTIQDTGSFVQAPEGPADEHPWVVAGLRNESPSTVIMHIEGQSSPEFPIRVRQVDRVEPEVVGSYLGGAALRALRGRKG